VSGRPTGDLYRSCGPCSANLPISLGNAFLDSVPVQAVTGKFAERSQFNRGAFRNYIGHYQADLSFPQCRSYCKKVFPADAREMVPLAVRRTWENHDIRPSGTGRVLDVPFDVFMGVGGGSRPRTRRPGTGNISSRCGADPDGVVKAVDMLLGAERPGNDRR